jgi:hypothetical protein
MAVVSETLKWEATSNAAGEYMEDPKVLRKYQQSFSNDYEKANAYMVKQSRPTIVV